MPAIRRIVGGEAGAMSQGPPWSKIVLQITFVCTACDHAWDDEIKGNQVSKYGTLTVDMVTDTKGENPGTVIRAKMITDNLFCPVCAEPLVMEVQAHDSGSISIGEVGAIQDGWWIQGDE